jgi:hypothetical protein
MGICFRRQFYERIEAVNILIFVTELFISNISFSKSTMPECCLYVGNHMKSQKREKAFASGENIYSVLSVSLTEVHELVCGREGCNFDTAFCESVGKALRDFPLKRSDIELFLKISGTGIYSDSMMQLKAMENIKRSLESTRDTLKKEVDNKGRIVIGLGTLGGIFLLIILL